MMAEEVDQGITLDMDGNVVDAPETPEPEIEVVEVDDTPESERQPERKPEEERDHVAPITDEELAYLGRKAKKRIERLQFEREEERRKTAAATRQLEEAISFSKRAVEEHQRLAAHMKNLQGNLKQEAVTAREQHLSVLRNALVAAREAGDVAKEAEIHQAIAETAQAKQQFAAFQPVDIAPLQAPVYQAPQADPLQSIIEQNPEMGAWLMRNPTYVLPQNSDVIRTASVIEKSLVAQGYTPGTRACYDQIDAKLRQIFPAQGSSTPTGESAADVPAAPAAKKPTPAVVGAPRVNGATQKKTITLTKSQVKIAQDLGLSPAQYAKYLNNYTAEEN